MAEASAAVAVREKRPLNCGDRPAPVDRLLVGSPAGHLAASGSAGGQETDGCHTRKKLLCAAVVRDRVPAFVQVVGRVGLEPTTQGL
jgi:hypothetical protein